MNVTRRTALSLGAALGLAAVVPWEASAAMTTPVRPVALGGVRLLESRYLANMRRTVAYLKFVDLDRLLHTFRLTAGLPTTAEPCGGWEAPDIQLRGHTTGHLLSGLALAAANTGDTELAAKGARLVAELAKCQAPSGYLSAFPESDFVNLEAGKSVWAPYYTIHKILAGLLDQHRLLGTAGALDVARGIARWIDGRTAPLSHDAMQKVLHTEFGGMNEALANLYAITRDPLHLTLARRFDHDEIFTPLAARQDTLAGRHANTDIAKIVGAAAEYDVTGEQRYRTISTYFWDQVVHHHSYVIGGNANAEFFGPPDQIVSQLGENTCENCNSYNMLKLGRLLFLQDPSRTEYLDHYEWTLLNQLLGEQDPDSPHGFVTYYTGLTPGTERKPKEGVTSDPGTYSSDYGNFTCDHGTGLETHVKYAENIYFTAGDTLYVNLFIPSTVDFHGARVRLETEYPYDETVRLRVDGSGEFALRVRIPSWVSHPRLTVNREPVAATPGRFATIRRRWRKGDVVELHLPMTAKWLPAPDNPAVRALTYGPLVLAARHGSDVPPVIPTVDPRTLRREPGRAEFSVRAGERAAAAEPVPRRAARALQRLLRRRRRTARRRRPWRCTRSARTWRSRRTAGRTRSSRAARPRGSGASSWTASPGTCGWPRAAGEPDRADGVDVGAPGHDRQLGAGVRPRVQPAVVPVPDPAHGPGCRPLRDEARRHGDGGLRGRRRPAPGGRVDPCRGHRGSRVAGVLRR